MNVKELRVFLSTLSPDTELFISRDPEGNGFNPIDYRLAEAITLNDKKAIILYPVGSSVDWEELFKE